MNKKLIFLDIDGTLTSPGSNVPPASALEAIRKAEAIEATDEEVEAEIAKYAEQSKMELDKFKENLADSDREYFAETAAIRKTIDFLKDNAE